MRAEIMEALELLDKYETLAPHERRHKKLRLLFFEALGIEDDGRREPMMTSEEFFDFDKPLKDGKYELLKGKTTVPVFFRFEAYHDVTFVYCFEDDTVYENRFYIGE